MPNPSVNEPSFSSPIGYEIWCCSRNIGEADINLPRAIIFRHLQASVGSCAVSSWNSTESTIVMKDYHASSGRLLDSLKHFTARSYRLANGSLAVLSGGIADIRRATLPAQKAGRL